MSAGLSPRASASRRRNGVSATSGISTGSSGARKIMAVDIVQSPSALFAHRECKEIFAGLKVECNGLNVRQTDEFQQTYGQGTGGRRRCAEPRGRGWESGSHA